MSVNQLDTIELSDFLRLEGYKSRPLRASSTRYLLDGGHVDQSIPITGGQLYLTGSISNNKLYGYFTGDQVDAMNVLRASRAVVDFSHHLGSWRVKVVGVDVQPRKMWASPDGEAVYVGTVTLLIK